MSKMSTDMSPSCVYNKAKADARQIKDCSPSETLTSMSSTALMETRKEKSSTWKQ
jgi:hypothetical protein